MTLRSRIPWLLALVPLALFAPFVARQNAWHEWSNYLWLIGQQARSIGDIGHPTYFLHEPFAVFYPQYVFYGGSLWAAAAYVSNAIGSDWAAYLLVVAAGVAMAYGGTWWLARQLGVGPAAAHLPALVVVTSPYLLVGNLYGRGDWAEAVALSALPLAFAGALAVAREQRIRASSVLAVVGACAVVAGSHNLTLLWGALFGAAIVPVAAWSAGALRWTRLAAVVAAAVLGVALDAWFLLPGVALAHDTQSYVQYRALGFATYDTWGMFFSPWPRKPSGGAEVLYPQAPVYALAWGLAAGALARTAGRAERRAWIGLATILVALVTLILWDGLWTHFPQFLKTIQFAVRLHGYVALAVAGLMIVGLRAARVASRRRVWVAAAVAAVAAQVGFAAYVAISTDPQRRVARDQVTRSAVGPSFSEGQQTQFLLRSGRVLPRPGPVLGISPADARREHVSFESPAGAAGRLFATNVAWSPLVRFTGDATIVGRDQSGFAVVRVRRGGAPVTVEPANPLSVSLGRAISLIALAVLLGGGLMAALRRQRPARGT